MRRDRWRVTPPTRYEANGGWRQPCGGSHGAILAGQLRSHPARVDRFAAILRARMRKLQIDWTQFREVKEDFVV